MQKALYPKSKVENVPQVEAVAGTVVIRFDGGTPCNQPKKGYGIGYGSYQINQHPIVRLSHNRPCSANVAEILTLIAAINDWVDTFWSKSASLTKLLILGDSKIALSRCHHLPKGIRNGQPPTNDFETVCALLHTTCAQFAHVETRWTPRAQSVRVFGH